MKQYIEEAAKAYANLNTQQPALEYLTFDDAVKIARGCTDYGGGHRGNAEHFEIYQHGIQTVINVLTAASKHGLADTQVWALHCMGQQPQVSERDKALEEAANVAESHSLAEQLARMTMANPVSHSVNLTRVIAQAIRARKGQQPAQAAPVAPEGGGV